LILAIIRLEGTTAHRHSLNVLVVQKLPHVTKNARIQLWIMQMTKTVVCLRAIKMLFSFLLTGPPPFQIKGDVNAIKWEILQRGPVVARLRLYEDFIYYVNGIYHVGEMIWNHIEFKIIF
jgi:hypothetical protein